MLLLDNAGWHTLTNLAVPDGLRLVYLPPCSPEVQPAETLWTLMDKRIVNTFSQPRQGHRHDHRAVQQPHQAPT